MGVKAVYQDGVFKPLLPVDLPEGEWVELDIVRPSQQRGRKTISLQGIWKDALRPEDRGDWVSETIAEIRGESAGRLNRLAWELSENLASEP